MLNYIHQREEFQSTHSLRSATGLWSSTTRTEAVSIHALLAECDWGGGTSTSPLPGFNPRTPCGVRPTINGVSGAITLFQSTHSLRSATMRSAGFCTCLLVSIHALLAECDSSQEIALFMSKSFNPRTPCGVRRKWCSGATSDFSFQSTHSLRSATDELPASNRPS